MHKTKLHKTSKFLWPLYIDMFVVKWMLFFSIFINLFPKIHHSALRGICSTLKYWPRHFLPSSPPNKDSKPVRPPSLFFFEQHPSKFWRTWLPPPPAILPPGWNVPSSKKAKTYFSKETKDFITNNEKEHLWMLKLGF